MNNIIINLQVCCKKNQLIPKKLHFKQWLKKVFYKKKTLIS